MSVTGFQRRRRTIAAMRAPAEVNIKAEPPKTLIEFTNKELKAMLDEKGIAYDTRANKDTLINLLEGAE